MFPKHLSPEARAEVDPSARPPLPPPVRSGVSVAFLAGLRDTILYTLFPDRLDPRDWMSASPNVEVVPPEGIWFDYLADTGDSGRAVATIGMLVQGDLAVAGDAPGAEVTLPAADLTRLPWGRFLIVGGDTAYPVATEAAIAERFVRPWNWAARLRAALPERGTSEPRRVYAIPGNHDWYDSLDGFNRLFRRRALDTSTVPALALSAYEPVQDASYFAIRFAGDGIDWGIDGLDTQNADALDTRQRAFFGEQRAASDAPRNRIVCTPEPARRFDEDAPWYRDGALGGYAIRDANESGARVLLSGDIHHYARYAGRGGDVIVQCGIAGAVVHPTHLHLDSPAWRGLEPAEQQRVDQAIRFPSRDESRALFTWSPALWSVGAAWIGLVVGFLLGLGPAGLAAEKAMLGLFWHHLTMWGALGLLAIWLVKVWPRIVLLKDRRGRPLRTRGRLLGTVGAAVIAYVLALAIAEWVVSAGGARLLVIETLWHLLVIGFIVAFGAFGAAGASTARGPTRGSLRFIGVVMGFFIAVPPVLVAVWAMRAGPEPRVVIAVGGAALAGVVFAEVGLAIFIRWTVGRGAFLTELGAWSRHDHAVAFVRFRLTRDALEGWVIGAATRDDKDLDQGAALPPARLVDYFRIPG